MRWEAKGCAMGGHKGQGCAMFAARAAVQKVGRRPASCSGMHALRKDGAHARSTCAYRGMRGRTRAQAFVYS